MYYSSSRDLVVLGTAGTGKTTMAVLRAVYLGHPLTPNQGPVLLVTFNNALVKYLRHLVPQNLGQVTVETYSLFARGYVNSIGKMPSGWGKILEKHKRREVIADAVLRVAQNYPIQSNFYDRDTGFFIDEIDWIADMGIQTETAYLSVDRIGRKTALGPRHRALMWKIRVEYLDLRRGLNIPYDWHDLASAVRLGFESDVRARKYRHVVIDEGQDLSPEALRSLVASVQPGGTISFFGDYHQQIYGQGLSWRACGLKVATVDKFYDNLRNTAEIARIAISMSQLPHLAATTTEDLVEPVEPTANGSQPILLKCLNRRTELAAIQDVAVNQAAVGTVGILARTWNEAEEAIHAIPSVRRLNEAAKADWDPTPGIYYGTYHAAKGLEFDVVILPFIDADNLPNGEAVAAYGTSDAETRDGKLLYVAVTRARAELLATYTTTPSTLLPSTPGLWKELVR